MIYCSNTKQIFLLLSLFFSLKAPETVPSYMEYRAPFVRNKFGKHNTLSILSSDSGKWWGFLSYFFSVPKSFWNTNTRNKKKEGEKTLPTTLSPTIMTIFISPYNLGDIVSKFLNSQLCPHVCHFFILLMKEYISFYFLCFLLNSIGLPKFNVSFMHKSNKFYIVLITCQALF